MTIQALKHTAFKIWTAAAVSGPLSLWLLSRLNDAGGAVVPLAVLAALMALGYVGSGWLASQAALRLIPSLLHEAGLWERRGDINRAEAFYKKVLALYDSFLVSPAARRKGMPSLVTRMARMYAAQAENQEDAARFMEGYLSAYPADRDIAETWLRIREYEGALTPSQQELASRIGESHPEDATLQMSLARLYLREKRTDFPALQTYRRAMADPRSATAILASDVGQLFLDEGRSDEWALPVYLEAARRQTPPEVLRCGLAACLRWIPPSERNAHWLAEARTVLGDPGEETLIRMSSGFVPPSGSYPLHEAPPRPLVEAGQAAAGRWGGAVQTTLQQLNQSGHRLWRKGIELLRRSPRLRQGLTWSLITGLGVVAAIFLIHTIGYLTPSQPPQAPPETPQQAEKPPPPPMPYTLQVAAYLKPEHAERYLKTLRAQGIDAYLTQAHGNDKTWYQVRIAHFPDKATALAHGSDLKSRGLIEDFYVAKDPKR